MKAFRSILFPVDFSPAADAMVPSVLGMAERFGASVTLLNAFDLVHEYSLAPSFADTGTLEPAPVPYSPRLQDLRNQRMHSLEEFAQSHFSKTSFSVKIEDGDPASVIRWAVQRQNADLIMMPTRGQGMFRRLLLGSVTAKVLHDVSCPVLTSAHKSDTSFPLSAKCRLVLCALDLNLEAIPILKAAAFMAQSFGAKICLLHIDSSAKQSGPEAMALELKSLFDRAVGVGNIPVNGHDFGLAVLGSSIPDGIRTIALEQKCDLIVVGRGHAAGMFSQAWSHLYTIICESPCPVLSV